MRTQDRGHDRRLRGQEGVVWATPPSKDSAPPGFLPPACPDKGPRDRLLSAIALQVEPAS